MTPSCCTVLQEICDYYTGLHFSECTKYYRASGGDPRTAAAEISKLHLKVGPANVCILPVVFHLLLFLLGLASVGLNKAPLCTHQHTSICQRQSRNFLLSRPCFAALQLLRSMAKHSSPAVRKRFQELRVLDFVLAQLSVEAEVLSLELQARQQELLQAQVDSDSDSDLTDDSAPDAAGTTAQAARTSESGSRHKVSPGVAGHRGLSTVIQPVSNPLHYHPYVAAAAATIACLPQAMMPAEWLHCSNCARIHRPHHSHLEPSTASLPQAPPSGAGSKPSSQPQQEASLSVSAEPSSSQGRQPGSKQGSPGPSPAGKTSFKFTYDLNEDLDRLIALEEKLGE